MVHMHDSRKNHMFIPAVKYVHVPSQRCVYGLKYRAALRPYLLRYAIFRFRFPDAPPLALCTYEIPTRWLAVAARKSPFPIASRLSPKSGRGFVIPHLAPRANCFRISALLSNSIYLMSLRHHRSCGRGKKPYVTIYL